MGRSIPLRKGAAMVRVPSVNSNSFDPDFPGEDTGGIGAPDVPASGGGLPFFDPGNSFADFGFPAVPGVADTGSVFDTDGLADDRIFAEDPGFDLLRGDMAAAADMFIRRNCRGTWPKRASASRPRPSAGACFP